MKAVSKTFTRRFVRYRTEVPLLVRVLGQDGYVRIHGRCFEIAEAGLGAVITSTLAAGEMVDVEISIPAVSDPVSLRAVVRYRMGFLHGFEFVGTAAEERQQISAYCKKLSQV